MTSSKLLSRIRRALGELRQDGVRRWASWRDRADTSSEAAYIAQLSAPKPSQRWRAASDLAHSPVRSPEAVQALIDALADPEPFVRWHAAEALAAQEAGRVFPPLVAALAEHKPLGREGVAESLGRLGGEAATQALRKHLADADPKMRSAVASALGQIADPTIGADLIPLLADSDVQVVRAAACALGRLGNPAAAGPLARSLMQPDQPLLVRRALAAALARAPHPDVQPCLLEALADTDPQVRAYAARALGHVGNEAAHAPLKALQADRGRLIRGTVGDRARRALALLERRGRRGFAGTKWTEEV